jgi:23S rRNA-/tRNA-specific pseudouridylate synthase
VSNGTATPALIGFPPPLLGPAPLRLPVLGASVGAVALAKPAGIAWERDTRDGTGAVGGNVLDAVRAQLAAQKPELLALGLERPVSVWPLETEISGVGLLVPHGPALDQWRNAFGSAQLRFTYEFLAADTDGTDAFECALPIARHDEKPLALVSHITGKKSVTAFRRVVRAGGWSWWEATTHYPRYHQVRLHAAECGLRIAGETQYSDGDVITLARLSPRGRLNKGEDRPLHDGICLRLASVDCTGVGAVGWGEIVVPEAGRWGVLRKRIARSAN